MANAQPSSNNVEAQIQSAFPLPVMEYVNQYTDEAVKSGRAPNPPPPLTDTYHMFGQPCHEDDVIIRPLEMQGLPRLYPEVYDKREELKKINVSILCNFLDLLDILVKCGVSQGRDEKIEDLNMLFINMHHLINEFRPHQARETLKVMMEMQKKNLHEEGDKLGKAMENSSEILRQCSEELGVLKTQHPLLSEKILNQPDLMEIDQEIQGISDSLNDKKGSQETKMELTMEEKDRIMLEILDKLPK
ncbi:unnamed protein product [Clavelina lepadiformis]|uniref:Mediator of RNA polymerase II transcription subunit 7 n=1 Tax=Clavelina lepadiformis TaxID=159417 RepID=A0ABP0GZ71_CLALP